MSIAKDEESFVSSRWIYTSALMAHRLDKAIITKKIRPKLFGQSDIRAAKFLFEALLVAAKESSLDETFAKDINLFTSTPNVSGGAHHKKAYQMELSTSLKKLTRFLETLSSPRSLEKSELEVASKLRKVFLKVYEDGGTSAYERCVAAEFVPQS